MTMRSELPRDFWFFLASRFCAGTAMTMLRAAIAWHVFDLSRSAFHLGLIGLVQFGPALGLMLVGGAVADSYDRRKIIMTAQAVALATAVALVAATERGLASLPLLYGTVLLVAVTAAFDNPARAALLPTLVTRAVFPRAVTIASTNQALAFITGPAVGGLLIAAAGVTAAYAAYAGLIAASITGFALLRLRPHEGARAAVSLHAIREGLRFVRRQRLVLGCMTLDMFAVIFGGATALLPIYANEILHVGARGYGLLTSSLEIGALLTSLVLMVVPPIRQAGRALLIAVAGFGVATIVFGLSRSFALSVLAYMAAGVADQISVVMRSTAVQLSTPDELRGRVSSVNFLFIGASNQLGAVESGFVAALTSATFSVVSGGVGCLVVLAIVALAIPELRRYRIGGPRAAA
ncbi:MAG: MFS transporter [Deltaproteobacteria bacterium]|nr:MFS transporter [Deltaproteobacteria bacterium]